MRTIAYLTGMAVLALAFAWENARSQSVFEHLIMPGPLTEHHAKYEKDCANCHEPFSKPAQTQKCLACHKDIANDREQKRSFHGRRQDAVSAECKNCHTEHKGRGADIVQLDKETFNHGYTNFALAGAHKSARCEGCHQPSVKYRKAATECVACHGKSEPHKGQLGTKCDGCHIVDGWSKVKPFDHSKTRFSLAGAHAKVACATCHVGERYKDLATTCISCHAIHDAHNGRNGKKCETCHTPVKWTSVNFDHAKSTRFPLIGAHAKLRCEACHKSDVAREKPSMACIGCHRKDDPHKGQLGTRCERCHNENNWREKVKFDHDLTRFPLVGLHAAVPCEACHRTQSYKDTSRACMSCHRDEHHQGRLGTDCAKCHNPNGWHRWRFDHDRQTQFPLTGAHRGLNCHACHREKAGAKVTASKSCFECHAADDAHRGSFGRQCDKCHTTQSFRQGTMGR